NPILQITINNLVSMIGAGPLLFLSAAMWRDSIKGKWVKRQYKGQVFRQLRWRGFFLVIASLMSGLFVCALLRTILSFSTLKLVEYLISSSFTYIGIVTSAFFAFHYNRRPCKVGKRILVVVETGARNPVIRKRA
ncbi:MAG: hypothetical protein KDD62_12085, partial [Bdellovibrionales bacterium]|nr:hypothetical protein [Bdellovibrionales bacterium]